MRYQCARAAGQKFGRASSKPFALRVSCTHEQVIKLYSKERVKSRCVRLYESFKEWIYKTCVVYYIFSEVIRECLFFFFFFLRFVPSRLLCFVNVAGMVSAGSRKPPNTPGGGGCAADGLVRPLLSCRYPPAATGAHGHLGTQSFVV